MICQLPLTASPSAQDRRLACAQLVLQWKGGFAPVPGGVERIDLKAQGMQACSLPVGEPGRATGLQFKARAF